MRKGLLMVVSGPSGTGKGTVCSELLRETPELAYSISATTRAPREGEVDGKNYYFLTKERFEQLIAEGYLVAMHGRGTAVNPELAPAASDAASRERTERTERTAQTELARAKSRSHQPSRWAPSRTS